MCKYVNYKNICIYLKLRTHFWKGRDKRNHHPGLLSCKDIRDVKSDMCWSLVTGPASAPRLGLGPLLLFPAVYDAGTSVMGCSVTPGRVAAAGWPQWTLTCGCNIAGIIFTWLATCSCWHTQQFSQCGAGFMCNHEGPRTWNHEWPMKLSEFLVNWFGGLVLEPIVTSSTAWIPPIWAWLNERVLIPCFHDQFVGLARESENMTEPACKWTIRTSPTSSARTFTQSCSGG